MTLQPKMSVVNYASFFLCLERNLHYTLSSFDEASGLRLLKNEAIEFVKYPLQNLLKHCQRRHSRWPKCLIPDQDSNLGSPA